MSTGFVEKFELSELDQWLKMGSVLSLNENELVLGWGRLQFLSKPSPDLPYFYTPDFYLSDPNPYRIYEKYTMIPRSELVSLLKSQPAGEKPKRHWKSPLKQDFEKVFNFIKSKIESDQIKKAVPVIFETSENGLTQLEKTHCLTALLETSNAGQYTYGFWDEEKGLIGKSPEILFRFQSDTLKTMALAGTKPAELYNELLQDEKELEEHQFVVEDIQAQLNPLGQLQTFKTQAEVFWPIAHLKTKFQLKLSEESNWMNLIAALHPTPALGALPRKKLSDLKFLECNFERGLFGAPFGFYDGKDKGIALVAIRNIFWDSQQVYLGSGCGVVSKSICDKEWQELSLKRETVKKNIGFL